jgi:hypothetical protein
MSEARLVGAILKNLRESYGVKINVSPSFERGMATLVETGTESRIIMIGASHMCRTAEFLPSCVNLAYPGFRLEKDKISNVENELKKLNIGEGDTVVLDLLSNAAFIGTDDDGLPTPASRAGDGSYHIIGSLTTSPPTALKRALSNCNSPCGVLSGSKVLLVCPIPRYVTKGCCEDLTHVTNISGPEYDDELLDFQDQHR